MVETGEGTRVRDPRGPWGDHEIGEGCTIGKFVETGDGVRMGDRCKVGALALPPPGVVPRPRGVGPHPPPRGDWTPVGIDGIIDYHHVTF